MCEIGLEIQRMPDRHEFEENEKSGIKTVTYEVIPR